MRRLQGVPASPGVALGPWVRIESAPSIRGGRIDPADSASEVARLAVAAEAAAVELESLATSIRDGGHPDEAAIFEAQAMIARDPALAELAAAGIGESSEDGVAAILRAAGTFADQLRELGDEVLSARAVDVVDVGDRIARHLAGVSTFAAVTLDRPSIVVAQDLSPSVTAGLPRERLLGLALEGSSPTAHAAILARAYGIPAVVGTIGILEALAAADGTDLAIDGETGVVLLEPDVVERERIATRAGEVRGRHEHDVHEASLPATTIDGTAIALLANIGTPAESARALELGARGVGLFRTEFLFLERSSPPSEDEQIHAYRGVIEAFAPHPVTIRLLDVGGDKPIPYLPLAAEANPFLGVRALRLAWSDPDLFVTQLRACYRAAAAGTAKVMAPMVADASDADLLLRLAERARRELADESQPIGDLDLGVMLEIPSSILVADGYFSRLSFASLGTNDLLQYALAVDRGNPALELYRDSLHPAILRLARMAVDAAERAGIELSVCGEMAGDPAAALALVGLGVRSLSMASSSLPAVRRAIRGVEIATLEEAAGAATSDPSAREVRARFEAIAIG
jgi:phosphoenolpyruvate-protein phosphotransferase